MGRIADASALHKVKLAQLAEKYGDDPDKLKMLGGASLIGGDLIKGYNEWANESLRAEALDKRQKEIAERGDISLASISDHSESVQAAQRGAFSKGGVKMSGSALNVISNTISQAAESQAIKQREVSFAESQLEVEKVLSKKKAEFAVFDTIFSVGKSAALASS